MSKIGVGKIIQMGTAKTRYLSIPSQVASDDRFPFETGEEVKITIDEKQKRVTVEKIE
jgi:hypothetical protein